MRLPDYESLSSQGEEPGFKRFVVQSTQAQPVGDIAARFLVTGIAGDALVPPLVIDLRRLSRVD